MGVYPVFINRKPNWRPAGAQGQRLRADQFQRIQRLVTAKATSELLDGERADVSWISTEEIDRDQEIVVARGMNDSQFRMNPIVTLQHCYHMPPIGKSLWRKKVKGWPAPRHQGEDSVPGPAGRLARRLLGSG
jgi:hypothetical protein